MSRAYTKNLTEKKTLLKTYLSDGSLSRTDKERWILAHIEAASSENPQPLKALKAFVDILKIFVDSQLTLKDLALYDDGTTTGLTKFVGDCEIFFSNRKILITLHTKILETYEFICDKESSQACFIMTPIANNPKYELNAIEEKFCKLVESWGNPHPAELKKVVENIIRLELHGYNSLKTRIPPKPSETEPSSSSANYAMQFPVIYAPIASTPAPIANQLTSIFNYRPAWLPKFDFLDTHPKAPPTMFESEPITQTSTGGSSSPSIKPQS